MRGAKRGLPHAVNKRDKTQNKLYQLRIERNISQRELADRAGIARNTVMLIENGDRVPNMDTIIRLCKVLEVSMNDVFGE